MCVRRWSLFTSSRAIYTRLAVLAFKVRLLDAEVGPKCKNVCREMRIRPSSVPLLFPSFELLSIYLPFPLIPLFFSAWACRTREAVAPAWRVLNAMCEPCVLLKRIGSGPPLQSRLQTW